MARNCPLIVELHVRGCDKLSDGALVQIANNCSYLRILGTVSSIPLHFSLRDRSWRKRVELIQRCPSLGILIPSSPTWLLQTSAAVV